MFGQVTDVHNTGRNYSFVTFADEEAAEEALEVMDGEVINGRKITVKWAKQGGLVWGRQGREVKTGSCWTVGRKESSTVVFLSKLFSFFTIPGAIIMSCIKLIE